MFFEQKLQGHVLGHSWLTVSTGPALRDTRHLGGHSLSLVPPGNCGHLWELCPGMASVPIPVILYSGNGRHWASGFFFPGLLKLSHVAFLHVGDLQAVVSLQATLLGPALDKVIIRTVLVLERAVVIVKIRLFAAEAPSYLPQGQLRRQKQTRGQRGREMRTGQCGLSSLIAV